MGHANEPLRGQAAMVVGASGAIGSAVARRLCCEGARVCLADLAVPENLQSELNEAFPDRALAIRMDVRCPVSIRNGFEHFEGQSGRLDILVTAAGVTSHGGVATITPEEWDRVHEVNLRGVFFCNQAAIKPMRGKGYGRIVNIGSVLAKNGGNPRPWIDATEQARAANAAYGAAKAGVHAMTLYLAKELASDGITVNAVAPGPIQSQMTEAIPAALITQIPTGRLGLPDEVAHAVAFLCNPRSAFITGEILDVNGGLWGD